MSRKIPLHLYAKVAGAIKLGAAELRATDPDGVTTQTIGDHIAAVTRSLLRDHTDSLADAMVARMIPTVLGDDNPPDEPAEDQLLLRIPVDREHQFCSIVNIGSSGS